MVYRSMEEEKASSEKELAAILQKGPPRGKWVAVWCDTLTNLERFMDRSAVREFGMRVLMQMSTSGSMMLIDSSAMSSLGANWALFSDGLTGRS